MSPFRRNLLILLLFAILALALTWPLLPHIATHAPGDGIDDPALAWNLWWARVSFVDRAGENGLVHNPFVGDSMFHPIGINLAFYTLTLWNGALSIPLQSAMSLTLASNLLLLSSFILSGFGAYLLALALFPLLLPQIRNPKSQIPNSKSEIRNFRLAALLAGLLYAFASSKLFYASLGQFNIASSQWLPFLALYLLRGLRGPWRPRDGFLLGLFLLFQTWAELTYGAFGVLLIAIVTVGAMLAGLRRWSGMRTYWGRIRPAFLNALIAAAMFGLGLLPYLANMLPDMRAHGDFLVEGGGFSDIFSADVLGFFFPTQLHPLFGGVIRALSDNSALRPDGSQFMVNKGQQIYPGYIVLLLVAVGLWRFRRRWAAWAVAALTGFFLWAALGPQIRINGYNTGIPGVFALLIKIPFFQANRYPSRYSVMIFLGLGLLAALGAYALLARVRKPAWRTALAAGLAALILFEHLSIPLPLSDFRLPRAYAAVVADGRKDALLDLPVGWRNGFNVFGKSDVIIMYEQWWQTYHGKPILGGNTSRNPQQKFQYFMENPVIGVLAALQDDRPAPEADFARAQVLAPDLLAFLNIHTVLVHRDHVPADFEARLTRLFPLDLQDEQDGVARYEARWPESHPLDLTPADPALDFYLDDGWGVPGELGQTPALWAVLPQSRLMLPASDHPSTLKLTLFAPGPQSLRFELDGRELARRDLLAGVSEITLAIPPADDGFPRHLRIDAEQTFDPVLIPNSLAPGNLDAPVGETGAISPLHIVARSAGKDVGDFGHIFIDGVDVSPNRRGYNLAAIDPAAGRLLDVAHFDTHDPLQAPAASAEMAAWINALPEGVIVAGAVRDAASLNLGDDAIAALRSLGVQDDIRGELRRDHAFVGVRNAAPGSAPSVVSDLWPATVVIGQGLTAPTPAFALQRLRWTPR